MATQPIITRPVLIIAGALCAVLFAYVIITKRGPSDNHITNPSASSSDKQLLRNTQIALPLRHQSPSAQFGLPAGTTAGGSTAATTPAPSLTAGAPSSTTAAGATSSYSNLPPVVNPGRPIPLSEGPGEPVSIPKPSSVLNPSTHQGAPQGSESDTAGTPAYSYNNRSGVPLSHRPAYTVLIKAPGDRTRKAVIVNH